LHNHFSKEKAELEADPEAEEEAPKAEALRVEAEAHKIVTPRHHWY
jgi:hypothetical protein